MKINKRGEAMKFLPTLLFLVVLVSCGKSTSKKSQSCTINSNPVDCSSINSQTTNYRDVLKVTTSSKIMVFDDFIEIKERNTKYMNQEINGKMLYCEISTANVMGLFYQLNGELLIIKFKRDGEEEIYKRKTGELDGLNGEWVASFEDQESTTITTLKFKDNKLELSAECKFKL